MFGIETLLFKGLKLANSPEAIKNSKPLVEFKKNVLGSGRLHMQTMQNLCTKHWISLKHT